MARLLSEEEKRITMYCQKLRDFLGDERWDIEAHDLTCEFAERLRKRYPVNRTMACYMHHVLTGSSVVFEIETFDFPGEDSVVLFLETTAAMFDSQGFQAIKSAWR